jgi:hypothetical protein
MVHYPGSNVPKMRNALASVGSVIFTGLYTTASNVSPTVLLPLPLSPIISL